MTDSTGKWTLSNIQTGTYEIDISKNTYGSTKRINQQFVGGGTVYIGNDYLSEVPNFTVVSITGTLLTSGKLRVQGVLSYTSQQSFGRNVLLFIGTTSSVSSNPATYLGVVNAYAFYDSTTFTVDIPNTTFNGFGIPSNSTAYIIAYPSSATAAGSSRYTDLATGRFFYTSLGSPSPYIVIVTPQNFVYEENKK